MMAPTPKLSVLVSLYKSESYLAAFIEQVQQQTLFAELELVFVSNEPSPLERDLLEALARQFPQQVHLLMLEQREPLGASWNRAWQAARAPLLAIWNVDDRRLPDSLERQVAAMHANEWALCYGDFVEVPAYGSEAGTRRWTPPYSPGHFRRAFAQGGAFWVLRRQLGEQYGYFDEQLRIAADMDYSFRLAANGLPMGKVEGLLGYFTDAAQGLSTRDGRQDAVLERNVVQLRYGVFDKLGAGHEQTQAQYKVASIQNFGAWLPVANVVPEYQNFLRARRGLWWLGALRRGGRALFAKLGLLGMLHKLQEKFLRREI